jgi:hypothetical protein
MAQIVGAKAMILMSAGLYELMAQNMRKREESSSRPAAAEVMSGAGGDLPPVAPGTLTDAPDKAQSGVPIESVLLSGENTQEQQPPLQEPLSVSPPPPQKQKRQKSDAIPRWRNRPWYFIASDCSESD